MKITYIANLHCKANNKPKYIWCKIVKVQYEYILSV